MDYKPLWIRSAVCLWINRQLISQMQCNASKAIIAPYSLFPWHCMTERFGRVPQSGISFNLEASCLSSCVFCRCEFLPITQKCPMVCGTRPWIFWLLFVSRQKVTAPSGAVPTRLHGTKVRNGNNTLHVHARRFTSRPYAISLTSHPHLKWWLYIYQIWLQNGRLRTHR